MPRYPLYEYYSCALEKSPLFLRDTRVLVTPDGLLLYLMTNGLEPGGKIYTVIPGFVISTRKKRKGIGVRVKPLTAAMQKKYTRALRKRSKGPLNFW